jgi:hypothetical protein
MHLAERVQGRVRGSGSGGHAVGGVGWTLDTQANSGRGPTLVQAQHAHVPPCTATTITFQLGGRHANWARVVGGGWGGGQRGVPNGGTSLPGSARGNVWHVRARVRVAPRQVPTRTRSTRHSCKVGSTFPNPFAGNGLDTHSRRSAPECVVWVWRSPPWSPLLGT